MLTDGSDFCIRATRNAAAESCLRRRYFRCAPSGRRIAVPGHGAYDAYSTPMPPPPMRLSDGRDMVSRFTGIFAPPRRQRRNLSLAPRSGSSRRSSHAATLVEIANKFVEEAALRKGPPESGIGCWRNVLILIAIAARHKPDGEGSRRGIVVGVSDHCRRHTGTR